MSEQPGPLTSPEQTLSPAQEPRGPTPDLFERVVWGVILFGALVMLVLAALLDPDNRGHGTHEQLGLPPCGMVEVYNFPCPSCGFTTTYALAMHLRWVDAFINQPFGFLLFLLTVIAVPTAIRVVFMRYSILVASQNWPWWRIILTFVTLWMAAWGYKIMTWPGH